MKSKTIQTYISCIIAVVTFIAIIFCYLCNDFHIKALLLNILYSIFGGAILSFALSIFDYLNAKRETISDFADEYLEFLKIIHNISFIDITELEEMTSKYIALKELLLHDEYQKMVFSEEARKVLAKIGIKISEGGIIPFLELETKHFKKRLIETMLTYIDVSKFRLSKLWKIASSICFLNPFFNHKHKEQIALCQEADEIIQATSKKALHFNMYLTKEIGNINQMANYVKELNLLIFRIEKSGNTIYAWEEKFDALSDELNRFISISQNTKYIKNEIKPFYTSVMNPAENNECTKD